METINHECYVSLEVAKLLKQAGFDWKCVYGFDAKDKPCYAVSFPINWNDGTTLCCSCPPLHLAQRWLREVKEQYILPYPIAGNWYFAILRPNFGRYYRDQQFDNYESALEAGINKCLTLLLKEE